MNWVYDNKWKTSIATSVLTTASITPLNSDLNDFQITYLIIAGTMASYSLLNAFSKIKPPLIINLPKVAVLGTISTYYQLTKTNQDKTKLNKIVSDLLLEPNPRVNEIHDARLAIKERDYGTALEHLARTTETKVTRELNWIDHLTHYILKTIHKRRANNGDLEDQLDYAFLCGIIDKDTAFKETWPQILEQQPDNLELKLMHAIVLSQSSREDEAKTIWKNLISGLSFEQIGESRNQVLTLANNEHTKRTVIIKKGKNLEKEYQVLRTIRDNTPVRELFTPTPVILFKEGEEDTLITFRRDSQTLDFYLQDKGYLKELPDIAKNLARLHSTKLPMELPFYNPIQELNRRFISRFGENEKAIILIYHFLQIYNKIKERGTTLIHGDFYPTNILSDGTIIDLETISYGHPSLDIETFLGHPKLDIDEEELFKDYIKNRSEIEQRYITISGIEKDFYTVFSSACQTGSFFAKEDIETSLYFRERTLNRIEGTGLITLREPFLQYLKNIEN
ncbi:MAG: phosphotransferase [Nanoarchaeota archaeon]|nr:phosphotransferase [Nanoarchaeota archaeon]